MGGGRGMGGDRGGFGGRGLGGDLGGGIVERFDNLVSQETVTLDADGNVLTSKVEHGTVTAVADGSITHRPRHGRERDDRDRREHQPPTAGTPPPARRAPRSPSRTSRSART